MKSFKQIFTDASNIVAAKDELRTKQLAEFAKSVWFSDVIKTLENQITDAVLHNWDCVYLNDPDFFFYKGRDKDGFCLPSGSTELVVADFIRLLMEELDRGGYKYAVTFESKSTRYRWIRIFTKPEEANEPKLQSDQPVSSGNGEIGVSPKLPCVNSTMVGGT